MTTMTDKPITTIDKIACLRRELALRRNVYPGRVVRRQMSQESADREIAVMTAMLKDYEAQE